MDRKEQKIAEVKNRIKVLRHRILGAASQNREWYTAHDALEYAIDGHEGQFRDDGETPYILHPVDVTLFGLTLSPHLISPVATVCSLMMHDMMEDCGKSYRDIEGVFGGEIADGVESMSKKVDGVKKTPEQYARGLGASHIGSIGKPCDRINNQNTMGNFSAERQIRQADETETLIYGVIKTGRRKFPQQELAFENVKLVLQSQVAMIRRMHAASLPAAA